MPLSALHEKIDDIPEQYRDLYTEKNGKFELTGIAGVKTQGDIDRLTTSLTSERQKTTEAVAKLSVWGDLNHDEVVASLDRLPELEAAAKGKLDDAAIDEIANKRADGIVASKLAPLERQLNTLTKERDEFKGGFEQLSGKERTRKVQDAVRTELVKTKALAEAHEDAFLYADRVFEIREDDGAIVTRDNVGVTPGMTAEHWVSEMQEKKPHWWPGSSGAGAPGAGKGAGNFANNPFTAEHWNLTAQGKVLSTQGRDKADMMAKAAGTTLGGARPAAKK